MLLIVQRYLRQHCLTMFGAVLSLGLLLAGLAACGSNGGTGSGGSGGGGSQNLTPTTSTQVQKCGGVQTNPRGVPIGVTMAKQTEDCFAQAYQKCQPASLIYNLSGVDTVTTRTFTIQNNGTQCSISDAVQLAIVPAKPMPARMYTCTDVKQQADGLHFSTCGADGNILVPAQ